jgi:hypothetical protein
MAKNLRINQIIKWFNKPLPKIICQGFKGHDHCKIDWNVVLFTAIIIVVFVFIVPFVGKLF